MDINNVALQFVRNLKKWIIKNIGNCLEDTTPVQPDTHKKFTEKHPQTLQKDTKSDPKDHQNGVKMALFGVQGVHWTLRGEDVSKMAPK